MSLSLRGFGQSLPEPEIGGGLAAFGALRAALGTVDCDDPDLGIALRRRLEADDPLPLVLAGSLPVRHAARLAELWKESASGREVRVQLRDAGTMPDGMLVRLLHQAESVKGVSVLAELSGAGVSWHWPMGVGFLADPDSAGFKEAVAAADYQETFYLVAAEDGPLDYEILILPWDLARSAATVLGQPHRLRADLVIVTGGTSFTSEQDARLVRVIAGEVECAGIAVASVPETIQVRQTWFTELMRQLAHNLPLDVALAETARRTSLAPPLLLTSKALLQYARLERFVARFGEHMAREFQRPTRREPMPQTRSVGGPPLVTREELRDFLAARTYDREGHGAVPISTMSRRLLQPDRGPRRMRKAGGGRATSASEDKRRVQTQLFENTASGDRPSRVLKAKATHTLSVRIAEPDQAWTSAPSVFPTAELPPSADGWTLTFVLSERPRSGQALPTAQIGKVHLPAEGPSEAWPFTIHSQYEQGDYRARLVILHRNRALQTFALRIPIRAADQAGGDGMEIEEELNLLQGYAALHDQVAFDAALVLNHGDDGAATALVTQGDQVALLKPEGMDETVAQLSSLLLRITGQPESELPAGTVDPKPLSADEVTEALRNMACHGRALFDSFSVPGLKALAGHVERLQVIEARPGAFVPVELFYDHVAPWRPNAKMCPEAQRALSEGCEEKGCGHNNDRTICPIAFWGMSRIIEHQTRSVTPGHEFQIGKGADGADRLNLLSGALFGASEKVEPDNRDRALAALQSATGNQSKLVGNWDEWESAIAAGEVPLLVLLSHTEKANSSVDGMAGLEIGGEPRPLVGIGPSLVRRENGRYPAVLLLGCKTKLSKIAHQDFVRAFRENGAAVVVATLSTIHEKHAVELLVRFIERLQDAASDESATFGRVLLQTRRAMLLKGDPFAMTLVAYGDVDWHL